MNCAKERGSSGTLINFLALPMTKIMGMTSARGMRHKHKVL